MEHWMLKIESVENKTDDNKVHTYKTPPMLRLTSKSLGFMKLKSFMDAPGSSLGSVV